MNPSIYTDNNKTWVCFGSGSIVVARHDDDTGQQMVWLGDTMKINKIGIDSGDVDWKNQVPGHTVILGFNKIESLDVVLSALMRCRDALVKNKEG